MWGLASNIFMCHDHIVILRPFWKDFSNKYSSSSHVCVVAGGHTSPDVLEIVATHSAHIGVVAGGHMSPDVQATHSTHVGVVLDGHNNSYVP